MIEKLASAAAEIGKTAAEGLEKAFDPDKRLDSRDKMEPLSPKTDIDPDRRITENVENHSDGLFSTRKERIDLTPANTGEWSGERGDSKFTPNDAEARAALEERGLDGIEYHDGVVDFGPCAAESVEIDGMSENRLSYTDENGEHVKGNYEQACDAIADKWSAEAKDGKTDWSSKDVSDWKDQNGYTIHECNDMKTCQLVPTSIHKECKHLGGCSECSKKDNLTSGGGFDE